MELFELIKLLIEKVDPVQSGMIIITMSLIYLLKWMTEKTIEAINNNTSVLTKLETTIKGSISSQKTSTKHIRTAIKKLEDVVDRLIHHNDNEGKK